MDILSDAEEEKVSPEQHSDGHDVHPTANSSGTDSLASLSSGAENISPMQPSSSGYSSENHIGSDKQRRKKQLQQCLREIKHFVGTQLVRDGKKKLDTLEALIQLLDHLKTQTVAGSDAIQPLPGPKILPTANQLPMASVTNSPSNDDANTEEFVEASIQLVVQIADGQIISLDTKHLDEDFTMTEDSVRKHLSDVLDPNDPKAPWLLNQILHRHNETPQQLLTHCRIRGRRKFGPNIEEVVSPCHIMINWDSATDNTNQTAILRIKPVKPAYQDKTILPSFGQFATRHSPNCTIIQTDFCISGLLGYLPHEIVGKSYLSFVHPEDFALIKEFHELMLRTKGKPWKSSKPYRMRVRNNDFVKVETEWSTFANPWSRQVEFIIAQHTVISAPSSDNIFADPSVALEPCLKQQMESHCRTTEDFIVQLMSRPINDKISRTSTNQFIKKENSDGQPQVSSVKPRRKDFCAYMDNFIEELARDTSRLQQSGRAAVESGWNSTGVEGSPQSAGDVISGSPPQSSGSGPTYYQMNYNDNIRRYFESQPKTHSSDEGSPTGKSEIHKAPLSPDAGRHEDILPTQPLAISVDKPSLINHTVEVTRRPNSNISDTPVPTGLLYEGHKGAMRITSNPEDMSAQMFNPNFFKRPNSSGNDRNFGHPQSDRDISAVQPGRRVPVPKESQQANVTISLMHRCQSAAADLTHCRPLTKEIVQKHTYEQEMAYMRSWKRRKSAENNQTPNVTYPTGVKHTLEPSAVSDDTFSSPFKIPRQEGQVDVATHFNGRPASMPVLQHLQQYYTLETGVPSDRIVHRSADSNVTIEHYFSRRIGSNQSALLPDDRQNFTLPPAMFPAVTNLNNNNNAEKMSELRVQSAKITISSDPYKSAFAPPSRHKLTGPDDYQPINLSFNKSRGPLQQQASVIRDPQNVETRGHQAAERLQTFKTEPVYWGDDYSRPQPGRYQEFPENLMQTDDFSNRRYQPQLRQHRDVELLQRLNQPQLLISQHQQDRFYTEMQRLTALPQETSTAVKEATDTLLFLENS